MKQNKLSQRIEKSRISLFKDNPFFAHLALSLALAFGKVGTACTDGNRLIFDAEFVSKLSDRELKFVVLHEVMHCVLQHCLRGKTLHSEVYNIACDIVVNSMILEMWHENEFFIEGNKVMHLAPDGKEGRLYSAEEIYYMLIKKDGYINFNAVYSFDRHDIWAAISNSQQMKEVWNNKVQKVYKEYGGSIGSQSIRLYLEEQNKEATVDWKQVLRNFLSTENYDYTFSPPDKRYIANDIILPSYTIDDNFYGVDKAWLCIDTSGSISISELTDASIEIEAAIIQAGLRGIVSFFDTSITEPVPFSNLEEFRTLTPVGGGGTSFKIIFDYLQSNMTNELPKVIIIFTDGYASWPQEEASLGIPVLWVISKGGNMSAPWGHVVEML